MLELWNAATAPVNLPLTVLLGLVTFYWGIVIVGLLDIDTFDLDLDLDLDVDADADVDLDAGVQELPMALAALKFFNVGQVPFTALISTIVVLLWCLSISFTKWLGITTVLVAVGLWIPLFFVAAFMAKFVTWPLKPIYQGMKDRSGSAYEAIVGKTCIVLSPDIGADDMGQAEIRADGAPVRIYVVTTGEVLQKGDEALVIDEDKEQKRYIVQRFSVAEEI